MGWGFMLHGTVIWDGVYATRDSCSMGRGFMLHGTVIWDRGYATRGQL